MSDGPVSDGPVKVGVALPNGMPGADAATLVEMARRADAGPFSAVGVPDRLVYPNLDPLMTLAAAAAVASRVRLVTNSLIAPLRPTTRFVKEVATLTQLAPGRVSLGVAVGARPEDYAAAAVDWNRRGRILDEQLEALEGHRAAGTPDQELGPALAGDVEILIAGASEGALKRLVRFGSGYVSGGILPEFFGYEAQASLHAWEAAGKPGRPRLVADVFFARDPDRGLANQRHYMTKGGPPPPVNAGVTAGRDGVRRMLDEFVARGADEVLFSAAVPDPAEVDWLAEVVEDYRAGR